MNYTQIIAKNTSVLLISQIISYVFVFFTTIYTARYLGVENFGILSLSIAFTGIFVIFADLGLSTLTVREVSRNKSLSSKYLVNFGLLKVILAFFTFFMIFLFVNILHYSQQVQLVIYIMSISVIFNSFAGLISSIFQAYEKMEYTSIGIIINSIILFVGVMAAIYYQLNVLAFATVYAVSNFALFLVYIIICTKKFVSPFWEMDFSFLRQKLKLALPFGITSVFVTIYYWIDSIMLSVMVGNEAVGLYNAAYRLILVLLFVPSVLNMAIFPAMSQFYVNSKKSLKIAYEKYFKYMAILGIPLGVGTTLLANKIILIIYGVEYTNATIALQILVWSTVIIFMSGAFARLLEASDKQILITKITAICAIINIILNLIIIPKYGYIGASVITVLTELLAFILGLKAVSAMNYGFMPISPKILTKIFIASMIMSIFIILFVKWNLIFLILMSTLIYFLTLLILKGFDNEDINLIRNIFNR